jgi:hypothetical protein
MSGEVTDSSTVTDLLEKYELSSLLDPSLHEMEQKFQGRNLFKYYSNERRVFFRDPKIRFTQKTALNDRFELTKRWNEFGSAPIRSFVTSTIEQSLVAKFSDLDYIAKRLIKESADRGQILTEAQQAVVVQKLKSPDGVAILAALKSQIGPAAKSTADLFFDQLAINSDAFVEEQVRELGIFSVSETQTNDQLWALYASEGRGFVVSFNVTHSFFRTSKSGTVKWPLFHKVTYSDEHIDDFWKNPLYLFAVKKERWNFEEEWRMIKRRCDCDEVISLPGEDIFLCSLEPGMVDSIIFGYAYDQANLRSDMLDFAKFDPNINFQIAVIDYSRNCISVSPCSP